MSILLFQNLFRSKKSSGSATNPASENGVPGLLPASASGASSSSAVAAGGASPQPQSQQPTWSSYPGNQARPSPPPPQPLLPMGASVQQVSPIDRQSAPVALPAFPASASSSSSGVAAPGMKSPASTTHRRAPSESHSLSISGDPVFRGGGASPSSSASVSRSAHSPHLSPSASPLPHALPHSHSASAAPSSHSSYALHPPQQQQQPPPPQITLPYARLDASSAPSSASSHPASASSTQPYCSPRPNSNGMTPLPATSGAVQLQRRAVSDPVCPSNPIASVLSALGLPDLTCQRLASRNVDTDSSEDVSEPEQIEYPDPVEQEEERAREMQLRIGSDVGIHSPAGYVVPERMRNHHVMEPPLGLTHLLPPPPLKQLASQHRDQHHHGHHHHHHTGVSSAVKAMLGQMKKSTHNSVDAVRKAHYNGVDAVLKGAGSTMPGPMRTALEKSLVQYRNESAEQQRRASGSGLLNGIGVHSSPNNGPIMIPMQPMSQLDHGSLHRSQSVQTVSPHTPISMASVFLGVPAPIISSSSSSSSSSSATASSSSAAPLSPGMSPNRLPSSSASSPGFGPLQRDVSLPSPQLSHIISPPSHVHRSVSTSAIANEKTRTVASLAGEYSAMIARKGMADSSNRREGEPEFPASSSFLLSPAVDHPSLSASPSVPSHAAALESATDLAEADGHWSTQYSSKRVRKVSKKPSGSGAVGEGFSAPILASGGSSAHVPVDDDIGALQAGLEKLEAVSTRTPQSGGATPTQSSTAAHSTNSPLTAPTIAMLPTPVSSLTPTPTSSSSTDACPSTPPSTWSVLDVVQFLISLGLREHTSRFEKSAIDGELLVGLSEEDMKELGVLDRFHRRKIIKRLYTLAPSETSGTKRDSGGTGETSHTGNTVNNLPRTAVNNHSKYASTMGATTATPPTQPRRSSRHPRSISSSMTFGEGPHDLHGSHHHGSSHQHQQHSSHAISSKRRSGSTKHAPITHIASSSGDDEREDDEDDEELEHGRDRHASSSTSHHHQSHHHSHAHHKHTSSTSEHHDDDDDELSQLHHHLSHQPHHQQHHLHHHDSNSSTSSSVHRVIEEDDERKDSLHRHHSSSQSHSGGHSQSDENGADELYVSQAEVASMLRQFKPYQRQLKQDRMARRMAQSQHHAQKEHEKLQQQQQKKHQHQDEEHKDSSMPSLVSTSSSSTNSTTSSHKKKPLQKHHHMTMPRQSSASSTSSTNPTLNHAHPPQHAMMPSATLDPYHDWNVGDDSTMQPQSRNVSNGASTTPPTLTPSSSISSLTIPPVTSAALGIMATSPAPGSGTVSTAASALPASSPLLSSQVSSSPSNHLTIIDLREIASLSLLNEGSAGVAFVGRYHDQGVVVKQPKKLKIGSEEWLELQLHMSIPPHPNVIPFIGICMVQVQMYLVTRFIERGSLKSLLSASSEQGGDAIRAYYANPLHLIRAAVDIAAGLAHLHSVHIVHRDCAARNILVTAEGSHIVSDFGLSRRMEHHTHSTPAAGSSGAQDDSQPRQSSQNSDAEDVYTMHSLTALPARWTAPEALRSQQFTAASDVYSLGLVMWEMLSGGQLPYARVKDNLNVIAGLVMGDLELDYPPNSSPIVIEFIKRAMQPVETRPTMSQLKEEMEGWLRREIARQQAQILAAQLEIRGPEELGIEMTNISVYNPDMNGNQSEEGGN